MKKRYHLLIIIGVLLVGLLLGSFFDLQINQAIYSDQDGFGLFMASFGVYPCYAGLAFIAGGFLSTTLRRKEMPLIGRIISFALSGLAYVMAVYLCGKEWPSPNGYDTPQLAWLSYLISAIVFAGVYVGAFFVCKKGDAKHPATLSIIAYFCGRFKNRINGSNRNCRLCGSRAHNHIVCAASRKNHQDERHKKHLARNVRSVLNRSAWLAHLRHCNAHITSGFSQWRHALFRQCHPDLQNKIQVTENLRHIIIWYADENQFALTSPAH